jgi:cellulose synthase/poly-beta-1,6-N-acetylglucosamine synthase-like glycosyltransferase
MLKPEPPGLSAWKQMIWSLGKLDFGGYMRILCRWKMRPEVLFGYGTILRNQALLNVADLYENGPWDTSSIVEDYRLSLDLRWMRYRLAIIPGALAFTDVPVTIRGSQGLWRQRIRWAAGTWQEIAREGWHVRTAKVWGTVLGCLVAAMLRLLTVALWITAAALHLGFAWSWWWSIPLLVSTLDRFDMTRYTKDANWKDVVVAISLLPLEFIGVLREAWTIRSAWLVTRKKRLSW